MPTIPNRIALAVGPRGVTSTRPAVLGILLPLLLVLAPSSPLSSQEDPAAQDLEEMRRQLLEEMARLEAPEPEPEGEADPTDEPPGVALQRFEVLDGGVLRDTGAQLDWTRRGSDARINWNDANLYCDGLSLGGRDDWRLPTLDELEALYSPELAEIECGDATCRMDPRFELGGPWVWSSQRDGPTKAWLFDFLGGDRYSFGVDYQLERALCVRSPGG